MKLCEIKYRKTSAIRSVLVFRLTEQLFLFYWVRKLNKNKRIFYFLTFAFYIYVINQ